MTKQFNRATNVGDDPIKGDGEKGAASVTLEMSGNRGATGGKRSFPEAETLVDKAVSRGYR